jgi:tetratricopeptide (TPR) repeat protein
MSQRPPAAPQRPSTIAEALERAVAALHASQPDEAERLAEYVLKSNRAHPLAAKLKGQARLVKGEPKAAIEPLRRAASKGHDAETETLLARALHLCGRTEEAVAELRKAVARRPAFPLAFLELGDRLGELGRSDEAVAVFEQGVALAPNAAVLAVGLGYLRLARNERAQARALFEQLRAAAPGRYDTLLGLAHTLVADGDYGGAAALYRQALAARPDDADTQLALGKCLLELGQRPAGEAAVRAATRGGSQGAWEAVHALAATPHGRAFLRPTDALAFLRGAAPSGRSGAEALAVDASVTANLA